MAKELAEPKRAFSETFSAMTAIKEHFGLIPDDVMKAAIDLHLNERKAKGRTLGLTDYSRLIARAILVERERCAKVADGLRKASTPGSPLFGAGMCCAADQIAIAIRGGTSP